MFSGAGPVQVSSSLTAPDLRLPAATLTADDVVRQGVLSWQAGVLTGDWTVPAGHRLNVGGDGSKTLGQAQLSVAGEMHLQADAALRLQSGSTLLNQGVVELADGSSWVNAGGAASSVLNQGLIRKTAGAASSSIGSGLGLQNQGVIDVQAGSIVLPTHFVNDGTLTDAGTLALAGTLTNDGHVAPGASPGTLSIAGDFTQGASGSLDIELNQGSCHDLLRVSGDKALAGTLSLGCCANCQYGVGEQILDGDGTLSGSFDPVLQLAGFATGQFQPIYDFGNAQVRLLVTQAVTAVPGPGTWALWLAGLAALCRRFARSGHRPRPA